MQVIVSGKFVDPEIGVVNVYVRPNSKRITSSWKGHTLCINVPRCLPADYFQTLFNERIKPDALRIKPQHTDTIDSELLHIDIVSSDAVPRNMVHADYVGMIDNKATYKISVPTGSDINDPATRQSIDNLAVKIMRQVVDINVVNEAWAIAHRLGLSEKISNIKATTAERRYGSCTSRGVISLSHLLATQPLAKRVETITHELAHLTHMDHSAAFHALHHQYLNQILPSDIALK